MHIYPSRSAAKTGGSVSKVLKDWLRTHPESLSFPVVWRDLAEVVNSRKQFHTLDKKDAFEAEISHDRLGSVIQINNGSLPIQLQKCQILDLWLHIRDLGVCIPQVMPSGLDFHSKYIIPLLAELPYMEPIRQSEDEAHLMKDDAIGLLLKLHFNGRPHIGSVESRQIEMVV